MNSSSSSSLSASEYLDNEMKSLLQISSVVAVAVDVAVVESTSLSDFGVFASTSFLIPTKDAGLTVVLSLVKEMTAERTWC